MKDTQVSDLRLAARAWRENDMEVSSHKRRSGIFGWLISEPNMSLHDRIDDLIDEIGRLRSQI